MKEYLSVRRGARFRRLQAPAQSARPSSSRPFAIALALLACAPPLGCGERARGAPEGPLAAHFPILGGEVAAGGAAGAAAVVGIYTYQRGEPALCTGTLLSSDLVLTAHHCVADSTQVSRGGASGPCETTVFEEHLEAGVLGVSRATELYPEALAGIEPVTEVHVPDTDLVCGADLALLVLGTVQGSRDALGVARPRWRRAASRGVAGYRAAWRGELQRGCSWKRVDSSRPGVARRVPGLPVASRVYLWPRVRLAFVAARIDTRGR